MEINYASPGADGTVVIPGLNNAGTRGQKDAEGVEITPDPSIVIKTRLVEQNQFSFDSEVPHEYVPPSLSGIVGNLPEETMKLAKVFLNICTHPLVAVPGQRKGLDEHTGKEIDGWRLPMSMGDLRPCYDKSGNAAIAADCILNPKVVREMKLDSNHFQFVCDLIVQCASRKFGRKWLGGRELDRRFKLPNMKYAGYVNKTTGLPIVPGDATLQREMNGEASLAVAVKQRVKGHGGKSPIIEEVKVEEIGSNAKPIAVGPDKAGGRTETTKCEIRIELFISNGDQSMSLFDFLKVAADQDDTLPHDQQPSTLRELIKSPKLKPFSEKDTCHESQLLTAPMPLWLGTAEKKENGTRTEVDYWSILAKCFIPTNRPLASFATPTVELSAFLLLLSGNDLKAECILPFQVDAHKTTITHNTQTRACEINMPLLLLDGGGSWAGSVTLGSSTVYLSTPDGPDPGTHQWDLQNAFGTPKEDGAEDEAAAVVNKAEYVGCDAKHNYPHTDTFSSDCHIAETDNGYLLDTQPLPEDSFHSRDALSMHLLQQQKEETKERAEENRMKSRDGSEVEYIHKAEADLILSLV